MLCLNANRIVDRHCALKATEGTSGQGAFAGFDDPRLGGGVVQIQLYHGVGVIGVWVGEKVVVDCCIVDEAHSILEDVDTDEIALLVIFNKLEGALGDFLGLFQVPAEFHTATEPPTCVQVAVAPCFGA